MNTFVDASAKNYANETIKSCTDLTHTESRVSCFSAPGNCDLILTPPSTHIHECREESLGKEKGETNGLALRQDNVTEILISPGNRKVADNRRPTRKEE